MIAEFRAALRGPVLVPGDPAYDEVAPVHNGSITYPAAGDRTLRRHRRRHGRGVDRPRPRRHRRRRPRRRPQRGGARHVRRLGARPRADRRHPDRSRRRGIAHVGGGATIAAMDHAAHAIRAGDCPAGIIGTTGVGGPDPRRRPRPPHPSLRTDDRQPARCRRRARRRVVRDRADAGRDPDLFWALRGGGGNFGIVTGFSFRLHPVGIVAAGPTLFPIERTAEILSWYREFLPTLPREMGRSSPPCRCRRPTRSRRSCT